VKATIGVSPDSGNHAVTRRTYSESFASVAPSSQHVRWSRIIGGLFAVAMFLVCCFPLSDTDLFWHLKTGEIILATGQVPVVDLYTFMDADKPWIDLHWGFQIVMALLYRYGGSSLVVLVKAAVLTAAFLLGWQSTGHNLPAWLRAIPWALAMVTISGRGFERPEIFSLLFLATWLWLLERVEQHPRWIWWLPVLQVVWINMHALFILGLVVGLCRAGDEVLRRVFGGSWGLAPSRSEITVRQGGYAACLLGLATLVNPYFEEGALFPLVLYRKFNVEQDFYSQRIGEFHLPIDAFRRMGFTNVYLNTEIALWCVAAVSFLVLAVCGRRWSPYRFLLFAGFSHLAWEATRNTNIFSLVAASVTCGNLAELWEVRSQHGTSSTWSMRANYGAASFLAAFIVLVASGVWHRFAGENKSFGLGERVAWYPHAAAKFTSRPDFPTFAFAANFGVASVYSYHNGPERRVFMDGRLEVCSRRTFEEFNDILERMAHGDPSWEARPWLRDTQGRLPVVMLDSRFMRRSINGLLNRPEWRMVFADPSCAVFLETTLAERLGLSAVSHEPLSEAPDVRANIRLTPPDGAVW